MGLEIADSAELMPHRRTAASYLLPVDSQTAQVKNYVSPIFIKAKEFVIGVFVNPPQDIRISRLRYIYFIAR